MVVAEYKLVSNLTSVLNVTFVCVHSVYFLMGPWNAFTGVEREFRGYYSLVQLFSSYFLRP